MKRSWKNVKSNFHNSIKIKNSRELSSSSLWCYLEVGKAITKVCEFQHLNFIPFCIFLCLFSDSTRSNNHGRISESSSGEERNLNCWDFEWMRKLKITRKIFLFTESISREICSRMLLGFPITRTESLSFLMFRDKNAIKISNVSYLCLSSTS